jgi:murein tripeptide amidase MpaA
MARQHPGETMGSFIMDEILNYFAGEPSIEKEFILWRFNIYCIPMVNVDGVVLGNYRGNAHGYDLNRCWDRESFHKLPEITLIKRELKRIHRKWPIELILDLHGHSSKYVPAYKE